MRKTILFVLCGVFTAGVVRAEEMVIQLKSGNSLTIQYSGSIQGVSWNGTTDGIAGLSMPRSVKIGGVAEKAVPTMPVVKAEEKKAEGSAIRFRWAEPQRED